VSSVLLLFVLLLVLVFKFGILDRGLLCIGLISFVDGGREEIRIEDGANHIATKTQSEA
jgi:hypothetical protein